MRANRWRIVGLWLLSAALVAALFATGILNKQKVWTDVQLEYRDDKKVFDHDAGDAYGMVAHGPYYDLAEGTYRLKWQMEGDGENVIRITCSNGVQITPAQIHVPAGEWQGEATFDILGAAHNVSINVEFCEGARLSIYNFRLYTPEYTDNCFTAAFLLAIVLILMNMHSRGKLTQERREALILLTAAVVISSLPVLRENSFAGWDTQFHSARLRNIIDAFESGQFPARVGGFSYNGYGAVTSIYYPDVLLYPFALMLMLHASMAYVINVLTVTCSAVCALCMYIAARRILGGHREALYAAILYVLSNFRIDRIYDSLMVGQMISFAVLPLFVLGLWEVFFGEKKRWPLLVLGATLVFQSHMLTTLQCAVLAALLAVVYFRRLCREKRLGAIVAAIAMTVLINLFTIVPMLMTYLSGATTTVVGFGIAYSALEIHQVFGVHGELGWALLLGMMAWLCGSKEEMQAAKERHILPFVLVGAICLFVSTELFPWNYALVIAGKLLEMFQFTSRFLTWTVLGFALCCGIAYAQMTKGAGQRALFAVLTLAVLCVMPRLSEEIADNSILEFGRDANPYMMNPEYQFEGTDFNVTRSRDVLIEGDAQMMEYRKEGTRIDAQVSAAEDVALSFPLFGFEGYTAELDGEEIAWRRGSNNRLTVDLPAGAQGELSIRYEVNVLWKVMDVVSLASALVLGLWAFFGKKRGLA